MHNIVASAIYPPLGLSFWWPLFGIGLLVVAIVGYWLLHFIRVRLALRAQHRLAELQKPNKDQIISGALHEIERVSTEVQAGTLDPSAGAHQISIVVRHTFDVLMNHRTVYSAKYEVASRSLHAMVLMMDDAYPKEFAGNSDPARFVTLQELAVKVVLSCN